MKKTVIVIIIFFILINLMACSSNKSESLDAIKDLTDEIIETSKTHLDVDLKEEVVVEDLKEEEEVQEEDDIVENNLRINSEEIAQLRDWWQGEWYGYWEIGLRDGIYESTEEDINDYFDCYAIIDIEVDDTGIFYIWDDNGDIANAKISFYKDLSWDSIEAGLLQGGNKWFGSDEGKGDWLIYQNFGNDNYMTIDATYEDEYGGFNYSVYLKPWGELWDDIEEYKRPPWYEEWYLASYEKTTMIEAIRQYDGLMHSDINDIK